MLSPKVALKFIEIIHLRQLNLDLQLDSSLYASILCTLITGYGSSEIKTIALESSLEENLFYSLENSFQIKKKIALKANKKCVLIDLDHYITLRMDWLKVRLV